MSKTSSKDETSYRGGYNQAAVVAMERGWNRPMLMAQLGDWYKALTLTTCPTYFEHLSGVVDALTDLILIHDKGIIIMFDKGASQC